MKNETESMDTDLKKQDSNDKLQEELKSTKDEDEVKIIIDKQKVTRNYL